MSSPTIYDALIIKKISINELDKIAENSEETVIRPLMLGGFFKRSELISWANLMWANLLDNLGILEASNYMIKVWKNVDNMGNTSVKYLGDLSNFVVLEPETVEYLLNDCYAYEEYEGEGEDETEK